MNNNFNKSVKNMTVSITCQVVSLLLSFISRSIFIHFLSNEYLGVSGLFSNILTLLSFTELGIGNVMVYSLYEPLKKNDQSKIKALLELYKKAYRIIALTIMIIGMLINPFILHLISGVPEISENIHFLFFLYLLNTVVSYLCTYKKSILSADQKMYVINVITSVLHIVMMIVQSLFLYLTKSFILYLIWQIVFTFLTNIVLSLIVNKQYKHILQVKSRPLDKKETTRIFSDVRALAISKVSGIVSTGTDNIIISKMFGLTPVGLVSNYIMLINSVNSIIYGALTSMISSIGNFNVDSEIEQKRKIFDELFFSVYIIYSFICVCIVVLAQPFIEVWIGKKYLLSYAVLINLVLGIYVGGINYPVYSFRTTMGYFKEVKYVYVACAVTNVFLSIILGHYLGIVGVFMATWISKLVLTEVADCYYSYKIILKRSCISYFLKYSTYFGIAALNACICLKVVSLISIPGIFGIFIKGIGCAVTNIVINIVIFNQRWEFKSMYNRVKGMLRRR